MIYFKKLLIKMIILISHKEELSLDEIDKIVQKETPITG